MGLFIWAVENIAPILYEILTLPLSRFLDALDTDHCRSLITSPITSYADQIYAIHRSRTSAGFSLDIPLIMLLASILKIFYWLGAHYDTSLFIQACVMIVMQVLLLHIALTHRPPLQIHHTPFTDTAARLGNIFEDRPYQFWQWRTSKPYWRFLSYFSACLLGAQVITSQSDGLHTSWTTLLGYVALAIEATLPLPQIIANQKRRGCKGFRLSVLANWLIGDAMKMIFFFVKNNSDVPWAFKLCGVFQACCDCYLGVQFYMFGDGTPLGLGPNGEMKAKLSIDMSIPDGHQNRSIGIEMDRHAKR